jgi:hypothetical protein
MNNRTCILLAVAATLALGAASLVWAPLNQDEGWYLPTATTPSPRDRCFPMCTACSPPW